MEPHRHHNEGDLDDPIPIGQQLHIHLEVITPVVVLHVPVLGPDAVRKDEESKRLFFGFAEPIPRTKRRLRV